MSFLHSSGTALLSPHAMQKILCRLPITYDQHECRARVTVTNKVTLADIHAMITKAGITELCRSPLDPADLYLCSPLQFVTS